MHACISVAIGLHDQYVIFLPVSCAFALGKKTRSFSKAFAFPKAAVSRGVGFFLHESILYLSMTKGSMHCIAHASFSFIWERATVVLPLCAGY
jgi:hypothetical protein